MSVDRTLHVKSGVSSSRNVLKRDERIAIMKDNGDFDDKTSPIGLPKTRVKSAHKASKAPKEAPEAAAEGEAENAE